VKKAEEKIYMVKPSVHRAILHGKKVKASTLAKVVTGYEWTRSSPP
jgi:hypothetical protein